MPRKVSLEQAKERLRNSKHGKKVLLIEESYEGFSKKCQFVDPVYGIWEAIPYCVIVCCTSHPKRKAEKSKTTHAFWCSAK